MNKPNHPWLFDSGVVSRNYEKPEVAAGSLLPKENLAQLMNAERIKTEHSSLQSQRFVAAANIINPLVCGIAPVIVGLQLITLHDAVQQVNCVHVGRILFLRTIMPAFRSIQTTRLLVEDATGNAIVLELNNYIEPDEDPQNVLGEGTLLAVTEPCLVFDSGIVVMRCGNPQCIAIFENEEEWRDAQSEEYYTSSRMQECAEVGYELVDFKPESVHQSNLLCDQGNVHFGKGDIKNALRYYSEGLRKCPINVRLLCNRGAAFMRLRRWTEALSDLETAISCERKHTKSRYRMVQVLLNLQRPEEAERHLIALWNDLEFRNMGTKSEVKSCEILMRTVKVALVEKKGQYDFKALRKEANCTEGGIRHELSRYHVDYIHPNLQVQPCPAEGKGKGLFAKATLPNSVLVLAEKAMVFVPCPEHCFPPPPDMLPKDRVMFNEICRDNLLPAIIHELAGHPEVGNKLYFLSNGSSFLDPATCKDDLTRVHIPRIRNILTTNHISPNTTQFENEVKSVLAGGPSTVPQESQSPSIMDPAEEQKFGAALWYHPSLLNHSCAPNCAYIIIGDFYFLVTSREIKSGEELTVPYCNMHASFPTRTQLLTSVVDKGFVCQCDRCVYLRDENPALQALESAVDAERAPVHAALAEGRSVTDIAKDTDATARRASLKQQLWGVPTEHQAGLVGLLNLEAMLQKSPRKALELALRELDLSEIIYGRHFTDFNQLHQYLLTISVAVLYGEFIVAEKLTRRAFDVFIDHPWCLLDKATFLALYAKLCVADALPMVEVLVQNVVNGRSMCNCPGAAFAVAQMAEQLRERFGYGKAAEDVK